MFRRFFSKRAGVRAVQRYLDGVAAFRRGDFTSIDNVIRTDREDIRKEIAKPHSPAIDRLLRANLVLLEELQDQRDQESGEKNWSIAFPLSAFWAKLSGRFNSQSRADLARLSEQISPGVGYLSSGWLAPMGMGVTLTIAMVALFTNPAEVAKAGTSPAAITRPAPEATSARSAQTLGGSRDTTDGDAARAKGVSASVTLPNARGNSGGAKLDPKLKLEPRKIVIRTHYEVQGGEYFSASSNHTLTTSCGALKGEQLCEAFKVFDAFPKPEAQDAVMCWEITDDRGTASYCVRSN